MNKTAKQAVELINELKPLVAKSKPEVVVCVPYTDLWAVKEAIAGSKIKLGAENVAWADSGAFTGEISAEMLKEIGVEYVIIGHSERRQFFGETDETVNMRLIQALKNDLKPIVCVGETLIEREKNKTKIEDLKIFKAQKTCEIVSLDRISTVETMLEELGSEVRPPHKPADKLVK
jgi:triosephosphate isomerase